MELSFRWYGPKDPVKLTDIRQSNADFIVTSLHQIPAGTKWSEKNIQDRIQFINSENKNGKKKLTWNVVESIPVHNDIKLRTGNFKKLIENYKDSIFNISKYNINTICYNFMPIIDWTRTQLDFKMSTDGLALRFGFIQFIIFEKFILKLKNLEKRYDDSLLAEATNQYNVMSNKDLENLKFSVMGGLPAAETQYTIEEFRNMLAAYNDMDKEALRSNFSEFLKEIMPIAEENKIKMALHPDDPPIPLFGLPRIVSSKEDYQFVFEQHESNTNGMTFCVGSLASNIKNDVYDIFKSFKDKINFIHLRNVSIEDDRISFVESEHLEGDVDFVKIIKMILLEEKRRSEIIKSFNIPMRPDHGHCLMDDQHKKMNPGYSAIGRMKGLAEIRGIIKTLSKVIL